MIIGIPVVSPNGMDSEVNEHFGMSEFFVMLEVEDDKILRHDVIERNPALKTHRTPAEVMADNKADVVLAGGIGPHMIQELLDKGIRVFRGAAGSAEQAFEDYRAGMLTEVHTANAD